MFLVPTEVRVSTIQGRGTFAGRKILQGEVVWVYQPDHDRAMSVAQYQALDDAGRTELDKIAYLSAESNLYIYPPADDPALYVNHSDHHNLTSVTDHNISPEPHFVANRDIDSGEELTNNYAEFDQKPNPLEWLP